jgi:uncharacterized protein involved in type VI secretion and phage assembly
MIGSIDTTGEGPRYFGVYPAIVTNIVDRDNLGRIEVKLPWLGQSADSDVRVWATLCTPYADQDQGFFVMPAERTQVVVAFEAGALNRCYIVGSVWNGQESQPSRPEQQNNKRLIKTRTGSLLEFDDTQGQAKVTLSMQSGHSIVMKDSPGTITIHHSNGAQIEINTAGNITIKANAQVNVQGTVMNVTCPIANFSGTIKCQTIITQSVVSPLYTPGTGNLW